MRSDSRSDVLKAVSRRQGKAWHLAGHPYAGPALAFLCGLTMFASYAVLRPIRDALGVGAGLANLPMMFWGTFVAMVAIQPAFAWLMQRFPRRDVLPRIYFAFAAMIAAFYVWAHAAPNHPLLAQVYFIWVSVYSLFVVSVFWSLMADLFDEASAARFFGFIASGLSVGGLAGSAAAAWLAQRIGTVSLLLVSSALLCVSAALMTRTVNVLRTRLPEPAAARSGQAKQGESKGAALRGFRQIVDSRYLTAIALFVLLSSALTTVLYAQQNHWVSLTLATRDERTALFGQLDFWVQLLSLAGQILLFGPLLRRLGPMVALCASPVLMIVACCAIGFWPSLPVVAGAMFVRRVGEYFLTKPARDLMFTVVPSDAKYTAKNLLDTVVFRAGDALSISAFALLPSSGNDLLAGLIGALLSIIWLVNSAWLAREFARRSASAPMSPDAR